MCIEIPSSGAMHAPCVCCMMHSYASTSTTHTRAAFANTAIAYDIALRMALLATVLEM